MSYICVKKLSLGGRDYYPGDSIPDGVILPGRVDRLKACGYIAEQNAAHLGEAVLDTRDVPETVFTIPIAADEGMTEGVPASEESVIAAAFILQMTVEQAGEVIKDTADETALTLVRALDSRKGVKSAAAARLEELRDGDA